MSGGGAMSGEHNPLRLDEIRARADAATVGPWRLDRAGWIVAPGDQEGLSIAVCDLHGRTDNIEADAEFITHGREDIPALCTEVEALRGQWEERDEFWLDMVGGVKALIEAHFDPVLSAGGVSDRNRLRQVLTELVDLPGIASEWRSENHALNNRVEQAEGERDAAREALTELGGALAYVFAVYLPKGECDGPRDCAGTVQGCRHCVPDARLDHARDVYERHQDERDAAWHDKWESKGFKMRGTPVPEAAALAGTTEPPKPEDEK